MAIETKPVVLDLEVNHARSILTEPIKVVDIDSIGVYEFATYVVHAYMVTRSATTFANIREMNRLYRLSRVRSPLLKICTAALIRL